MNILHQYTLVLENIALGLLVEGMIAFGNGRVVRLNKRGLV
jgi:hypothetical protein